MNGPVRRVSPGCVLDECAPRGGPAKGEIYEPYLAGGSRRHNTRINRSIRWTDSLHRCAAWSRVRPRYSNRSPAGPSSYTRNLEWEIKQVSKSHYQETTGEKWASLSSLVPLRVFRRWRWPAVRVIGYTEIVPCAPFVSMSISLK